jgi:hypothetical protein
MNIIQPIERTRHPFLDGKTKLLLIDGKWVEAASGKTFESINPATGKVLAKVAEGDAGHSVLSCRLVQCAISVWIYRHREEHRRR